MFNKINLRILSAELVRDPNLIMKADPYAIIRTSRAETRTSTASNGGKHPRWNESFNLDVTGDNSIYIAIFDEETIGKDNAIAETFINLNQLQNTNGVIARSFPLTYKGKNAGELFCELQAAGANANVNNQALLGQANQAYLAQPNQQTYGQNPVTTQVSQTTVSTQPDYYAQPQVPNVHGTGFVAPIVGSSNIHAPGAQSYVAPVTNQPYVGAALASAAVYNDKAESRALHDHYKLDEKMAREQAKASDAYLREQHKASEEYMKDQEKVSRAYAKEQEKIAESQSKIQTKYAKEREKSAEHLAKMDERLMKEQQKVNEGFAKLEHSREKQIAKNQENLAKIDEKYEKERLKQQERLAKAEEKYQKEQLKESERIAKHSSGHIPVGGAYVAPPVATTGAYVAPVSTGITGHHTDHHSGLHLGHHSGNNSGHHLGSLSGHQEVKAATINNLSTGRAPAGPIPNIAPVGSAVLGTGPTSTVTEVSRTEIAPNPIPTGGFATGANQAYAQPPLQPHLAGYDANRLNPNNVTIDPNLSQKLSRDNSRERSGFHNNNAQINYSQSSYGSTNYVAPVPTQLDMNVNPRVDLGMPPANLAVPPATIIDNRMDRSRERIGNQVHSANTNLDNRAFQEVHTQMANMNMSEHRLDRSRERLNQGLGQVNYNLPPQTSHLQQSVPVTQMDQQATNSYRNLFGKAIVKIVRAELAKSTSLLTKMSPYIMCRSRAVELRSHVAEGAGKTPVWNAIFDIQLTGDSNLYFGIWDRDTFTTDDLIADVTFDLRGNMKDDNRFVGYTPVYRRGDNVGRVLLEIEFFPDAQASNLPVTYGQDNTYMNINRDQFNNYAPPRAI